MRKMIFIFLTLIISNNLFSEEWVRCNNCSVSEQESLARAHSVPNQQVRVNVIDFSSESFKTFRVTHLVESEPGFSINKIYSTAVDSTLEEIKAVDNAVLILKEFGERTSRDIPISELGLNFDNAGYLSHSFNGRRVAAGLSDYFGSVIRSVNLNLEAKTVGALSAASKIDVQVSFPDGSIAKFKLDSVVLNLDSQGNAAGITVEFELSELRDADGNLLPMSANDATAVTNQSVSGGAAGSWATSFSVLGISYSGSSSGGIVVTCELKGGKVVCTGRSPE